jgi:TetR/AcrR family transcriptional regulator, transcriptional repressor for nem operon
MDVPLVSIRPRLHYSRAGIDPIYVGMLAHLCTPGLFLVGGIGDSLRGGTAIGCDSMRSAASASSFPGFAFSSASKATFIMENLRKGAVPKPGSSLRLSVAEAVRDLADRTGMTTPSLYNAFGDKRATYRLVLDRYIRHALETCSAIFGGDDPPLRALERYFDATVEEALADMLHKGCFVVNTALEVAAHDQDFRDVVTEVFDEIEKCVRDCVAAGQRDGSILTSQPPADIARLALSTILGLRVLARTDPDRELLTGVVRPFFVLLRTR